MRRNDREITVSNEIESIIRKADVCRIALANDNLPYMVTLNFGYLNNPETFYFHCANKGKKLDMISKNSYVCFELDIDHEIYTGKKGCDWGMRFSSVIGYGNISIVSDNPERIAGLNCILMHYGGSGENIFDEKVLEQTTILRLDVSEMTGKKK